MLRQKLIVAVMTVTMLFSAMVISPLKVQASFILDVVDAAIAQDQVRKSLNYYDSKGRNELFAQIKKQEGVNQDPERNRILEQIVVRLSDAIAVTDPKIKEKPYNYFVNNQQDFNAYCTLGNNITINAGVFTFFGNNQDQVAAVVAHEMAHGQQKHVINGAKKKLTVDFISSVVGSQTKGLETLAVAVVAVHTKNTGITKPNEWEADNVAFDYMCRAGYNVGAPAAVWQKVIEKNKKQSSNFFVTLLNPSTHPGSEARRDNYAKKIHEYSNKKVSVDAKTGEVKINGKTFMTPTEQGNLSALERSYLVAGNLAALYKDNALVQEAYFENGTVKSGDKAIVTPNQTDITANELVKIFNEIK